MKRLLAMLLALVMVLSLVPVTALQAFAEDETAPAEQTLPEGEVLSEEETAVQEETVSDEGISTASEDFITGTCAGGHTTGTVGGVSAAMTAEGLLPICSCNFPDAAFRSYLAAEIDTDYDGYLSEEELLVVEINCDQWNISSLQGIEYFAELYTLQCEINNLTELDVSHNLKLGHLYCGSNDLTALDVSMLPELFYLYCYDNQLTEVDVSNNPKLASLDCSENALTKLDVSQNPALEILNCGNTGLTELDLSGNPKLRTLYCGGNQIPALDLSANPELTYLSCGNGILTELDLSDNPVLKTLSCSSNNIRYLNISENTALTTLDCAHNPLSELDVSHLAELVTLRCNNMDLSTLDVTKNAKLEQLICGGNGLEELDLSGNPELMSLDARANYLTELDLSHNPYLFDLVCHNNELGSLDLSYAPDLRYLYCFNCGLTELDLSNNTHLEELDCSENMLTHLDLTQNTGLYRLDCGNNCLLALELAEDVSLDYLYLDNQYWYGDVEYTMGDDGSYVVDLAQFNISYSRVVDLMAYSGGYTYDPANDGVVYFENDPNEGGFTYWYSIDGENTMQVYINWPEESGGGGEIIPDEDNSLWENAPAVALGDVFTVELTEEAPYAYYTLTPDKDFTCKIYSSDNADDIDPVMYLYQKAEDGWYMVGDYDDNSGRNFLCTYEMKAGVTYGLQMFTYSTVGPYTVTVDESEVVGLTVLNELDVYEYTEGYYEDGHYEYVDMIDRLEYQLTLSNGEVVEGRGWEIEYQWNGQTVSHNLHFISNQYDEPWTVGNSYVAEITVAGLTASITVNIIAPPESVTLEVDPVRCPSYNSSYSYGYNEETGEYEEYLGYDWIYCVDGTLTIDGTAYEVNNGHYVYNGVTYQLNYADSQSPVAPWEVGSTYDATVSTMGAETNCSVEIYEAEDDGGDYDDGTADGAPALESMAVLTAGSSYTVNITEPGDVAWFTFTPTVSAPYAFASTGYYDTYGYLYDADLNLLSSNDDADNDGNFCVQQELEAGETYVYAVRLYSNNFTGSFTVQLIQCASITAITMEPVSLPEGSWGWADVDNNELYHQYTWWNKANIQVTFSDGGTAMAESYRVQYNGVNYPLECLDEQGDVHWKSGNTYPVAVAYGDVMTESTVTVTPCQIKSFTVNNVIIPESDDGYYSWQNGLKCTVTLTNGAKVTSDGTYFEYKDDAYWITTMDNQGYGAGFQVGENPGLVIIGNTVKDVTITVRAIDESIPQVENVRVTSVTASSIKIAFDKATGASKYDIYINGAYKGSTTSTSYTVSGLTAGYVYEIAVAAAKTVNGKSVIGPISDRIYQRAYNDIKNYYLRLEYTSTVYDGTAKEPSVTLKKTSSGKAIASEFYDVAYLNNTQLGQVIVAVVGMGTYGGIRYTSFDVLPQQVTNVQVTEVTPNSATITFDPVYGASEYWIYRGSTRVDIVKGTTYTYTGLKAGTTYNLSVRANTISNEYILEGYDPYSSEAPDIREANFTGAASETVTVKPTYDLSQGTMTLKYETKPYTGKAITNTVTVKNADGKTLTKGTHYTVAYQNNKLPGEVTVTVTGKGQYAGQLQDTFVIVPKAPTGVKAAVVDGTSIRVTYKAAVGATEYSVFANGEYVGTTSGTEYVITGLTAGTKYSVTVTAGVELDFGRVVYGANSAAVSATPRHNMSICTVELAENEFTYTGKAIKPVPTVYGYQGEVLTQGVDYTLSYVDSKNTGRATVKVTGKGAYTGTASEYYYIYPAQVTGLKVSSTTTSSVKVSWTKASTNSTKHYNVYVNGEQVGRTTYGYYNIKGLTLGEIYSVYVVPEKTLKSGTYYGAASETIEVWPGTGIGSYKVTLEYTKAVYEGAPLCPSVVVKSSTKASAVTLVQGVDYTVEYANNNAPGKMQVIIKGIGVYTGTITKTITVSPAKVTGVTATATGAKTIHVEFDEVAGATQYWVYVNGTKKATVTETSCDIAGLYKNKTYKVTVKAVTKVGTTNYAGALSDPFSVKTLSA